MTYDYTKDLENEEREKQELIEAMADGYYKASHLDRFVFHDSENEPLKF
tara:strand:- start:125 stop:271 length:147 start_codon:yes stop_codon:yes gene_type:complete